LDIGGIISDLKAERDRISQAIGALEGAAAHLPQAPAQQKRGNLTPAGRKRIFEALKKRWAERRAEASKPAVSPKTPAQKKRGGLTPAGRKRLSELMKKRWAEKKKKTA